MASTPPTLADRQPFVNFPRFTTSILHGGGTATVNRLSISRRSHRQCARRDAIPVTAVIGFSVMTHGYQDAGSIPSHRHPLLTTSLSCSDFRLQCAVCNRCELPTGAGRLPTGDWIPVATGMTPRRHADENRGPVTNHVPRPTSRSKGTPREALQLITANCLLLTANC